MWEVFYTPHTDDETIAMAGAILRAHAAGHSTLVVLVTDHYPSTRGARLFPDDAFAQRRLEWLRAMAVLGVTKTDCWELDEVKMIHEPQFMAEQVLLGMEMVEAQYAVVHHHAVALHDVHVESSLPTPAHIACAKAAIEFQRLHPSRRVSLHYVYIYSEVPSRRVAPVMHCLTPSQSEKKREALDAYRKGIGYGYASVPELIDGAAVDLYEYSQEVPHDIDR
jgi:LmbE family N-acetylglucosaminyl deacetylase